MTKQKIRLSARSRAKSLKRFAVFSGDHYYPGGGWLDYQSSHATLNAARQSSKPGDWFQIVDLTTGAIVEGMKHP